MFINKSKINTNLDIAFAGQTCYPSSSIAAGGVAIFFNCEQSYQWSALALNSTYSGQFFQN